MAFSLFLACAIQDSHQKIHRQNEGQYRKVNTGRVRAPIPCPAGGGEFNWDLLNVDAELELWLIVYVSQRMYTIFFVPLSV